MALIVCKECGKEFSDKADKCPNCGCPVEFSQVSSQVEAPKAASSPTPQPVPQAVSVTPTPAAPTSEPKKKNSKMAVTGFILSLIFCVPVFPFIGLILCIIALRNKAYKNGLAKAGIVIAIIALVLGAYIWGNNDDTSSTTPSASSEASTTASNKTDSTVKEENTVATPEPTEAPTPEPTPAETKEEFMASCEEPDYKDLARYPDDNIGKRIKLKVKISQILQGGLFDSNEYYRVYTDTSGYDLYLDDEYFMYDERIDDDTKLLQDDIIEVYGEFAGTETVTRALTGTKEDVPSFKAYYIDIIE